MGIVQLIIVAMLAESVWETIKMIWQNDKFNVDRLGAIIVGLVISFGTGLDLLSIVGITDKSYIGIALTGLLISRGSNFIHDLIERVDQIYQVNKVQNLKK